MKALVCPCIRSPLVICALLLQILRFNVSAQQTNVTDLTSLPIEKLLEMEVTSVARKPESLLQSPAAIAVISADDIRRSGAMSIPEALRLAPGIEAARLDANEWAISARGFNDVFANKLLVLQDGRTLYSPLFSGVFWDVQGAMLEDIDRIEVVRGPGATLWGANAVNGVINIMTKSAKDTQGFLASALGGTELRTLDAIRYGGRIGDNAWFRVYGQYMDRDDSATLTGKDADDGWQIGRGGFRVDWDVSDRNTVTLQGDAYRGAVHQIFGVFDPTNPPGYLDFIHDEFKIAGGNVLGRWTHVFSPDSELQLQMYYDGTERRTVIFSETRHTFDIDFQHRFPLGSRNDVVWGGGYRVSADGIGNTPTISLIPDDRAVQLFSGFVQDEITLVPKHLRLTLGTKLERNDFTGLEVQPSGKLLWTPNDKHTFWASVSRAVRTPSRSEDDIALVQVRQVSTPFGPVSVPITLLGNPAMDSEKLLAYEIGYRTQPLERFSLDLAAFYNVYDDLRSLEPNSLSPTNTEFHPGNGLYGETYGFELAGTIELARWWRLRPSYSFLSMQLHTRSGSHDIGDEQEEEGKSPRNQAMVRSSMDLPHNLSFDVIARYVDRLKFSGFEINSYWGLDVRLGWRPNRHWELAVGGQDLLYDHRPEFAPSFVSTQRAAIQRGLYGKVTVQF